MDKNFARGQLMYHERKFNTLNQRLSELTLKTNSLLTMSGVLEYSTLIGEIAGISGDISELEKGLMFLRMRTCEHIVVTDVFYLGVNNQKRDYHTCVRCGVTSKHSALYPYNSTTQGNVLDREINELFYVERSEGAFENSIVSNSYISVEEGEIIYQRAIEELGEDSPRDDILNKMRELLKEEIKAGKCLRKGQIDPEDNIITTWI
jgi:hypothetical protein